MRALIIIDMVVRDVKYARDKVMIANQLKLITEFNKKKLPVILVGGFKSGKYRPSDDKLSLQLWGEEISEDPKNNRLIPELLNTNYDYYIHKPRYSSFYKTPLEHICKKRGITELYITGISLGVCLYFTAADAFMRGIRPILITDASKGPSLKIDKQNIQNYKDILGTVLTTREAIRRLSNP